MSESSQGLAVADGRVLLQSGAQGGNLLGQSLQLPCSLARPEGAVEVVGAVGGIQGEHLSFVWEEGKVDLFQRLHHLCQTGATQLTEQGLRAGVCEEDVCCFVGEGRGPPEICDQGLYRLLRGAQQINSLQAGDGFSPFVDVLHNGDALSQDV